MASEASRKRAEQLCHACRATNRYADSQFHACDEIAAALDEARAEGEKAAVTTAADVFASDVAQAYERGFKAGAERERWECHRIADSWAARFEARGQDEGDVAAGKVAVSIAARGPMRGPGEEK